MIKEQLWVSQKPKCNKINWKKSKFEKISRWSLDESKVSINLFKEVPLKNLFRGMRYFYLAEIYAQKPGTISEETLKSGLYDRQMQKNLKRGNPVEFKTLNLDKIIKILNSVANDEFQPTLIASIALDFNLTK